MGDRAVGSLGLAVLAALVWSGVAPHDRLTWLLEVAPILIGAPILAATYRRFRLTGLLYALIAAHALVLILGGAYTYARVPLGFWIQDLLDLHRNPYDKIGHFMQGFVPALIAREILLRRRYLTSTRMTAFLSLCVAMALSACYELVEWWSALALGQGADSFLGTQGDVWDTQSDMAFALLGACAALLLLSRLHDRQIRRLETAASAAGPGRVVPAAEPVRRGSALSAHRRIWTVFAAMLTLFTSLSLANELFDLPHYLFGDEPTSIGMRRGEVTLEILTYAVFLFASFFFYERWLKSQIRILEGFLPICAHCKKIRQDMDWRTLEEYISAHSLATFSHALCPDCIRELYPEHADLILSRLAASGPPSPASTPGAPVAKAPPKASR